MKLTNQKQVSDFPADYPPYLSKNSAGETSHIVSHGGSCICGPLGNIIAEPVWDKEDIVYATLDMGELVEARVSTPPPLILLTCCDVLLSKINDWVTIDGY